MDRLESSSVRAAVCGGRGAGPLPATGHVAPTIAAKAGRTERFKRDHKGIPLLGGRSFKLAPVDEPWGAIALPVDRGRQSALWMAALLPSLGVRDRRLVVLVCLRAAVSGPAGRRGSVETRADVPAPLRGTPGTAGLVPFETGSARADQPDPTYRWGWWRPTRFMPAARSGHLRPDL